jgi:hypothetical protein
MSHAPYPASILPGISPYTPFLDVFASNSPQGIRVLFS